MGNPRRNMYERSRVLFISYSKVRPLTTHGVLLSTANQLKWIVSRRGDLTPVLLNAEPGGRTPYLRRTMCVVHMYFVHTVDTYLVGSE